MVVVPLVMSSVMSGILGLGDIRNLGRPGAFAVLYYLGTTILAVIVGLLVVNAIQPGVGSVDQEALDRVASADSEENRAKVLSALAESSGVKVEELEEALGVSSKEVKNPGIGIILKNLLLMLFTDNLFRSAAEPDLLPLIFSP